MDPQALQQFTQQVIAVAKQASEKILSIYADETQFGDIDYKADDSPLTKADKEANDIIEKGLEGLFQGIPILSEEGKHLPYEERKNWSYFWLVDPLDGTKEFIKRNGEFTVNIALVKGKRPILGVVHIPVSNTTYYAIKDLGAYVIEEGKAARKIEANEYSLQDSGLRFVVSRSHLSPEVEAYLKDFEDPQAVSRGSSLKFMLVADSKADVYPRLAPTMEWDTGAAQIIVEEAGGSVINHETNTPLEYNKEVLRNPHFIAFGRVK